MEWIQWQTVHCQKSISNIWRTSIIDGVAKQLVNGHSQKKTMTIGNIMNDYHLSYTFNSVTIDWINSCGLPWDPGCRYLHKPLISYIHTNMNNAIKLNPNVISSDSSSIGASEKFARRIFCTGKTRRFACRSLHRKTRRSARRIFAYGQRRGLRTITYDQPHIVFVSHVSNCMLCVPDILYIGSKTYCNVLGQPYLKLCSNHMVCIKHIMFIYVPRVGWNEFVATFIAVIISNML